MAVTLTENFDAILLNLDNACKDAVDETALSIVETAQGNAPVDTGALRASIHAVTPRGSGWGKSKSKAIGLRPEIKDDFAEKAVVSKRRGTAEAVVEAGAPYASLVHNGNGKMAARPFLEMATAGENEDMESRLKRKLAAL